MNFSQNASFALVMAEAPLNEYQERNLHQWQTFLDNVQRFAPLNKETTTIHDNVWLIPLNSGMPFLCKLFDTTKSMGIPLRILFLDEEPDWIKHPPDAKPASEV